MIGMKISTLDKAASQNKDDVVTRFSLLPEQF